MTILIRPATEADIPFILKGNQIIEEKSYEQVPNPLTAQRIKDEVLVADNPMAFIMVAEVDGEHAGFIIYSFYYLASEGQAIWLTNLYIDPFCRRSTIGKNMLNAMRNRHPHICGIYGAIAQGNTIARHFFSRVGAERYDDYRIYGAPLEYVMSVKS